MESVTIIDIIKHYQIAADNAVKIFQKKFNVDNILEGWHSRIYSQTGNLKDEGIYFYAFHGIGLAAHFKDKIIDFDFAFLPEQRHDGFDLWRLKGFIKNQRNKYLIYKDETKIEKEFYDLIKKGIIINPKVKNSTTLYFFADTLKLENKEINDNIRQLQNESFFKNFLMKFWNKLCS